MSVLAVVIVVAMSVLVIIILVLWDLLWRWLFRHMFARSPGVLLFLLVAGWAAEMHWSYHVVSAWPYLLGPGSVSLIGVVLWQGQPLWLLSILFPPVIATLQFLRYPQNPPWVYAVGGGVGFVVGLVLWLVASKGAQRSRNG